jgi:hypothetical protein
LAPLAYSRTAFSPLTQGDELVSLKEARAAVESHLREQASHTLGREPVKKMDLLELINRRLATGLSADLVNEAHAVRMAANGVLHPDPEQNAEPASSEPARRVLESARLVLKSRR